MQKRIMLIDDDNDACLLITQILTNAGYHVDHRQDGNIIVNNSEAAVDLYILDNYMPNIDGLALTKFLKLKNKTRESPVLIISGNPNICSKAKYAGASAFITKPFDTGYFIETVNNLINDANFRCFEEQSFEHHPT